MSVQRRWCRAESRQEEEEDADAAAAATPAVPPYPPPPPYNVQWARVRYAALHAWLGGLGASFEEYSMTFGKITPVHPFGERLAMVGFAPTMVGVVLAMCAIVPGSAEERGILEERGKQRPLAKKGRITGPKIRRETSQTRSRIVSQEWPTRNSRHKK